MLGLLPVSATMSIERKQIIEGMRDNISMRWIQFGNIDKIALKSVFDLLIVFIVGYNKRIDI